MITDCHVHIQPLEMLKPGALEAFKRKKPNFDQVVEFCRSPKAFLKHLDAIGIDRAVLINYVAPEVMGFTPEGRDVCFERSYLWEAESGGDIRVEVTVYEARAYEDGVRVTRVIHREPPTGDGSTV